jgi:hypothetical protein
MKDVPINFLTNVKMVLAELMLLIVHNFKDVMIPASLIDVYQEFVLKIMPNVVPLMLI